jgi:hypothetical protein
MANTIEITLPSTMRIEVRPWAAPELVRVGAAARATKGPSMAPFYDMLTAAWVSTIDPGPYTVFDVGSGPKPERPWTRMLYGDIEDGLKQVRAESSGDVYYLPFDCPVCGEQDRVVPVPLSELKQRKLSDEARARVASGKRFEATVAGAKITFDLQYGRHEDEALELLKALKKAPGDRYARRDTTLKTRNAPSLLESAAVRIATIDGEPKRDLERWEWVCSLITGEVDDLRDAFDAHECGVDHDHDVTCGSCHHTTTVSVPLVGGRYFFNRPSTRILSLSSSPTAGEDRPGEVGDRSA